MRRILPRTPKATPVNNGTDVVVTNLGTFFGWDISYRFLFTADGTSSGTDYCFVAVPRNVEVEACPINMNDDLESRGSVPNFSEHRKDLTGSQNVQDLNFSNSFCERTK